MAITIKYTGTQIRWPELSITGKQSVWNPGQIESREDAEAALLLATGVFTDEGDKPLMLSVGDGLTLGGQALTAGQQAQARAGIDVAGGVRTLTGGGDVALGDSITQFDNDNPNRVTGNSWFESLCLNSRYAFRRVRNAGVSGNTLGEMLTRFDSDVAPYKPARVHLQGGTNDVGRSVSLAQSLTDLKEIANKVAAIGAELIIYAIPPRNDAALGVQRLNAALCRYALLHGHRFVNAWKAYTTNGGLWVSGASDDGTHPIQSTHFGAGVAALAQLTPPNFVNFLRAQNDSITGSILPNGLFLTDTNADGLPDGWIQYGTAGTVPSLVAVSGESWAGNWLTLTATAAAGGRAFERSISMAGNFSAGDVLGFSARIKTSGGTGNMRSRIRLIFTGATNSTPVNGLTSDVDGVVASEVVVPVGATALTLQLWVEGVSGAFTGVMQVAQMDILNLTTIGIAEFAD